MRPSSVDLARLRRTYPEILLAWIVLAAASLSPALIASSALSSVGPDPSGALAMEALLEGGKVARASWIALGSPLLLLLLASPVLSVAWLRALGRGGTLREALATGARRYPAAVASSLFLVPVLVVALLVLVGLPLGASAALEDVSATSRDLATLIATLPGLSALAAWAAWHDTARARLALETEGWLSATLGAWRRLGLGAVLRYALFFTAGLVIAGLGVTITGMVTSAVALVLGQLFVLARLSVRGLYLASLVRYR